MSKQMLEYDLLLSGDFEAWTEIEDIASELRDSHEVSDFDVCISSKWRHLTWRQSCTGRFWVNQK